MDWPDRSLLEWASWRLASELVRRHPSRIRLIRGHPGGGQYDVLWLSEIPSGDGEIILNRHGTIQVHGRFDGRDLADWKTFSWEECLANELIPFVQQLEDASGLKSPSRARPATPRTLTYRVLATIASTVSTTGRSIEIQEGYIDTSGYGGGANRILDAFPIPEDLLRARDDDLFGEAGYRFWIVVRDQCPIIACEQTAGTSWTYGQPEGIDLMRLYRDSHRSVQTVASKILKQVEHL